MSLEIVRISQSNISILRANLREWLGLIKSRFGSCIEFCLLRLWAEGGG